MFAYRINLEGETTPARVDADGNAIKEADGTLKMRPAQPMEYANGVCTMLTWIIGSYRGSEGRQLQTSRFSGTVRMMQCNASLAVQAMRDPVVFRCNPQHHWRTGNKWKVKHHCSDSLNSLSGG